MEDLFHLIPWIFAIWFALALGVVIGVRWLYRRWMLRLMQARALNRVMLETVPDPRQPGLARPCELVDRTAPADPASLKHFARRSAWRVFTYAMAGACFGVAYGLTRITLLARSVQEWIASVMSIGVVLFAAQHALLPVAATLALVSIRRKETPAAGLWTAALIVAFAPLGAVRVTGSNQDPVLIATIAARLLAGLLIALAYLRLNSWRAERSRWSWQARGLHAWFLLTAAVAALLKLWSSESASALLILLIPAAVYITALRGFFAFWPPPQQPRRLLFLRVFGRGSAQDRLYATLARQWTNVGPVRVIGAPDVAALNMGPSNLAEFVSGRLRRKFEWSEADLERRAAEADRILIDRRYSTVEVLCDADSWRVAMRRLARDADVVVMDLRGYTRVNRGCAWELQQLVDLFPLTRVILCVDDTTNMDDLQAAVEDASAAVGQRSPNGETPLSFSCWRVKGAARELAAVALSVSSVPLTPAGSGEPGARASGERER